MQGDVEHATAAVCTEMQWLAVARRLRQSVAEETTDRIAEEIAPDDAASA